jgi:diguanylate cyclase (GGDEF)-like protein
MSYAERLRQRIQQRFGAGPVTGITVSIGVAQFSAEVQSPRALIDAADAAMYESKRAGRNRVILSSAPPPDPAIPPYDGLAPPPS